MRDDDVIKRVPNIPAHPAISLPEKVLCIALWNPYRYEAMSAARKVTCEGLTSIARECEIRRGEAWFKYDDVWASAYSTQTARDHYAAVAAGARALQRRSTGSRFASSVMRSREVTSLVSLRCSMASTSSSR
jgi:hypothetical protein